MKALILLALIDVLCIWSIRGRSATIAAPAKAAAAPAGDEEPRECVDLARAGRKLLRKEMGLEETRLTIKTDDLCAQIEQLDNTVAPLDALKAGVTSLLTDGKDVESPLALAKAVLGAEDDATARAIVQDLLSRPTSSVRLMAIGETPEGGEDVELNWILEVEIPELGDTAFWAVIDRSGEMPAYNYGFN